MNDRTTVNLVVGLLGLLGLTAVVGLVLLGNAEKLTDQLSLGLFGTVTACIGAIAGLLGRTDSIDLPALDALKAANDESFLPVLQTSLDKAKDEGRAQAAAEYVPATLQSFEPVGDPVPAAASADLAAQLDEAVAAGSSAVDVEPDDEPPDPFDGDEPLQPVVE